MENKRRGPGRPKVKDAARKVAHSISFAPDVLAAVNAENPHDRSKGADALMKKGIKYNTLLKQGLVPPLPTEI